MSEPRARSWHVKTTLAAYRAYAEGYAARPLNAASAKRRAELLAGLIGAGGLVAALVCGPGAETVALREAGLRVVGLDMTPEFLRIARDRYPAWGYVRGDLRAPPFGDDALDGAWASASLVHLAWAEVGGALQEIRRVLRPGGVLHCSVQIGATEGLAAPSPSNPVRAERFYAYYEPEDWRQRLVDAGFEVLSLESARFDASEAAERCNEGASGFIDATARAG
ncbi:MAG: class I SAM-dependent methyltransferase [Chloroflexi bacterium]|nr:class I SAM-dependent methyltransferase [Chloroflexota bacterium]